MLDKTSLVPQRDIAENFVALLTGMPNGIIRLRFIHDSDRGKSAEEIEGTITQVWTDIVERQRQGFAVFYFMNAIKNGPGSGKGGCARDADVTSIRTLATDHDKGLPDDWEWHVHPRIIVRTSTVEVDGKEVRKGQALWPVNDCPVAGFKPAQFRLAAHYGTDPSISNPSRVLRLPGTLHLKNPATPQIVTFEDHSDRWAGCKLADVMQGLPATEDRKPGEQSPASGTPVSRKQLRTVLSYLDADAPRSEWIKVIAAVHATPLLDDPDESERRQIAHEFSEGKLDRLDRFKDVLPQLYTGASAVDKVFDTMPPKVGGVGYGSLFIHARKAGYDGVPYPRDASTVFKEAIAGLNAKAEDDVGEQAKTNETFPAFEPWQFKDRPAPRWVVDQIVREKAIHMNFGKSESVKTFFTLDLLGSVATGIPAFGKFEVFAPGDVVFFCDEDPDDVMTVRWPAWCKARGIKDPYSNPFARPGRLIVIPRCPLVANPEEVENAIKRIRDLGVHPKLIAIDTAAKAMGGMDQDNACDAGILVAAMTRFRREFGNAGWITHHPKKSDPSDMRGSGALTNDTDIVWQSIRSGQTLAVKLECMKMKGSM